MANSPSTSWQIDGETVETVTDFIFLGSKITADGDCSHEIKRCLLLGRRAVTSLDSILKSRDIALPTKVRLVKSMVFPVVMYRCELDYKESWAPKNWCFWNVVLEKTLESLLDCKEIQPVHPKGNQSWIFIGRADAEAETPILWPPGGKELAHWKRPWCWERLKVGGEGDNRGWDCCMASPTWCTWVWASSGSWWWTGKTGMLQSMGSLRVRHDWETELNWLVNLDVALENLHLITFVNFFPSIIAFTVSRNSMWMCLLGYLHLTQYIWEFIHLLFYIFHMFSFQKQIIMVLNTTWMININSTFSFK